MKTTAGLTARGVAAAGTVLLLGIIAWAVQVPQILAVAVAILVAGLLSGCVMLLGSGWQVRSRRIAPGTVRIGDPVAVRITVAPTGRVALAPRSWTDRLARSLSEVDTGGAFPPLTARAGDRALDYTIVPRVRGSHDIGPLVLEFRDPLGFVRAETVVHDSASLLVLPRPLRIPLPGTQAGSGGSAAPIPQRDLDDEADLFLRRYAPSDPLHQIHWKTTARRAELMVRQDTPTEPRSVAIFIDRSARHWGAAPGSTEITAFEAGLGACLFAAKHYRTAGHAVTVSTVHGGTLWEASGPARPGDEEYALARALGELDLGEVPAGPIQVPDRTARSCVMGIVLAPRLDGPVANLAAQLSRYAAAGVVLLPAGHEIVRTDTARLLPRGWQTVPLVAPGRPDPTAAAAPSGAAS